MIVKTSPATRGASVVVTKPSGAEVIFGVYESEREADRVCERLRSFGIDASVTPRRRTDVVGASRG